MVLRIERSSIHDGSGFRTVVFLKGCPMRCQWCSTPESQSFVEETAKDGTVYGTRMTVEQVIREVRKDSLFYFISAGGLTLSGGEILAQPEFSLALLKNAKMECFRTAVETSFIAPWEKIQPMLPYIDTAYVDLKVFDPKRHKEYCGISNERILKNWAGRIYWEMCRLPRRNTWRHAGRSSGNMCKTFDKRSIRR